jgi:4-carboxymuconolactone decarboxylase
MSSRLSKVDESDPRIAEAFRRTRESRGYVSNLLATMCHAPELQKAHAAAGHILRFESDLTELQRELAICLTVRDVPYGWAHHGQLLQQLGFSDAQMAAVKAGRVPDSLSQADQALCAFALAYASCKGVPDDVLARFRAHFSDKQAVEVGMLVSNYLAAGAFIIAFQPEIEPPEILAREREWQKIRPGAAA